MKQLLKNKLVSLEGLDKSTWNLVRFGDLAFNISERVEPHNTDAEIYVGLEHLDSDSIHIRRRGIPADVKGTKLRVYKSDIIFGKRRAYQRKAAIADFDGICSAHAMVLRANPEGIDPDLFPFFIHSDAFMNRAVEISEGSLSPTIKWKILAKQQFRLPPMEMQKKLATLLWAVDETEEKYFEAEKQFRSTCNAFIENLFHTKSDWNLRRLGDVAKINTSSLGQKTEADLEFYYLDIASIIEPKKIGDLQRYKFKNAPSRARRKVNNGNLVLSLVRPYHKAFVLIEDAHEIIASTGTAVIETDERVLHNRFLFHQFFSGRFERYCAEKMTGTNYPAITPKDLREFMVFVPENTELQKDIAKKLDALDANLDRISKNKQKTFDLLFSLINSIF